MLASIVDWYNEERSEKMEELKKLLEGDSVAFDLLYKKYQPVVYKLAKKYYLKDYDLEDWLQEGRIVFHRSLERFDETKQLSIGQFFKVNLENHIRSLVRKQCAYKRITDTTALSLDQKIEACGEEFIDYLGIEQRDPLDSLIIQEKLESFPAILSSFERSTLQAYIKGEDLEMIAAKQTVNTTAVRSAYDRAKKKMKFFLSD
jgi:RNA polymerase sporulation-specific sigma factor